jgi:hypothetical protein
VLVYLAEVPADPAARDAALAAIREEICAAVPAEQRQAVTVTVGPHPDDPELDVILGDAPGDEENPSPFLLRRSAW